MGVYFGGATTNAVARGGSWLSDTNAGMFAFNASHVPSYVYGDIGFRCSRDPLDTQAPIVPTHLTAMAVSGAQIDLSWTASTDNVVVANYKVYRNSGATPIATPTGTTYNNTGLAASTAYSYTVSACDAAGNCSAQSVSASTETLDGQAPTVPTGLTAVAVSSCHINLSWTASADDVGVTSYKIYRDGGAAPIATPTGTTYSDTGLTASTLYSYTVSACDAAANFSAQSTSTSATTMAPSDTQSPTVPTSPTAVAIISGKQSDLS